MSTDAPSPDRADAVEDDLGSLRARLSVADDADRLAPVGLRVIVSGPGAVDRLPAVLDRLELRPGAEIALLTDGVPKAGAGGPIEPRVAALAGSRGVVRAVLVGHDGRAHADPGTLEATRRAADGAGCLISVGSGTVVDIAKMTAHALGGIPHVVVQTAASVNGFADDQSVLVVEGVKRTTSSRWPDALVIDEDVLAGAPVELTRAGLGDLIAMFTAPADWYLARLVGQDDSYSETAVELAREHGDEVLGLGSALAEGSPAALTRLGVLLAVSGISMGVAGRTAPSSGMEHTVSHLLEMEAAPRGGVEAWHGARVGVTTILASLLWRRVLDRLEEGDPDAVAFPDAESMRSRVESAFAGLDPGGAVAAECWRDYERKLARWHAERSRVDGVVREWGTHRPALERLLASPERIVATLAAAGAPTRFSELTPPVAPETARWALGHCHLMRDRFTVADLAAFAGIWESGDVDSLLEEAASLGGGL